MTDNALYADLMPKPASRILNWRPSLHDWRDLKLKVDNITVPTRVDLRPLCSPVMDQGQMGSCSGNALAAAVEFLELMELRSHALAHNLVWDPSASFEAVSRLFLYWNERAIEGDPHVDAGVMTMRNGCTALLKKGICRESSWPYSQADLLTCPSTASYGEAANHKIQAYYALPTTLTRRQCLAAGFPFVMGIPIYDSFMSMGVAMSGEVPDPTFNDSREGGHALLVVGYDMKESHYIVRNSWGTGWGDAGYCYISFAYVESLGSDFFTLRLK